MIPFNITIMADAEGLIDLIGFLVVFAIVIVSSVLKKINEAARNAERRRTGKLPGKSTPQMELENFLKSIAAATGTSVTAQAPPPPAAGQSRIHPAYAPPAPKPRIRTVGPPPAPVAPPPVRQAQPRPSGPGVPAQHAHRRHRARLHHPEDTADTVPGIGRLDTNSLRNAIIAREILGPPVAMRTNGPGTAR